MNERVNISQEKIVHIENQNEGPINLEVKVLINITTNEAQLHQVVIDPLIPSPGGLLQPIEGFLQPAYMGVSILDVKPSRLLHIHLFLYRTMRKGSLHIHMMETPSLCCDKGNDRSDGGIAGDRCKYIIIIYAFFLREASGNKSSGLGTTSQTSFFIMDSYSSCIASLPTLMLYDFFK